MKSISLLKDQKYHTAILLCLIIFIAAFLRLYYLTEPSFSSDDIKSIEKSEKICASTLVEWTKRGGHHLFYYLVLHYWKLMAGSSEFALRLPTAIFGILSVFAFFKLSSLIFDNKTSLIGTLLLAVNPEHFFPSFALKQYTLALLLALTSLYLLLMALRKPRTMLWIAFGICNVVLLYTHKSAIFVVLTEIVYIAIVYRKYKYSWQIFSSIGVIFLILIALFFLQKRYLQIFSEPRWLAMPTFETFLRVLYSFIAGFYIKIPEKGIIFADAIYFKNQGLYIDALPLPAQIGILAFFSFFLLLGIFKYFGQRTTSDGYKPLIYTWAIVPILSAYGISFLFYPIFGPTRYHLFWSCSILLLIARGFATIGKLRFVCPILLIAVCIHLFPIITKESNPRILNWKGVANYLRETVSDGERVHFIASGTYRERTYKRVLDGEIIHFIPSDFVSLPLRYYYKGDVYIGIDEVFKKIAPNADVGRSKGIFLIEVGKPLEKTMSFDIMTESLNMFFANKDVKQFHYIKVTHYWNQKS